MFSVGQLNNGYYTARLPIPLPHAFPTLYHTHTPPTAHTTAHLTTLLPAALLPHTHAHTHTTHTHTHHTLYHTHCTHTCNTSRRSVIRGRRVATAAREGVPRFSVSQVGSYLPLTAVHCRWRSVVHIWRRHLDHSCRSATFYTGLAIRKLRAFTTTSTATASPTLRTALFAAASPSRLAAWRLHHTCLPPFFLFWFTSSPLSPSPILHLLSSLVPPPPQFIPLQVGLVLDRSGSGCTLRLVLVNTAWTHLPPVLPGSGFCPACPLVHRLFCCVLTHYTCTFPYHCHTTLVAYLGYTHAFWFCCCRPTRAYIAALPTPHLPHPICGLVRCGLLLPRVFYGLGSAVRAVARFTTHYLALPVVLRYYGSGRFHILPVRYHTPLVLRAFVCACTVRGYAFAGDAHRVSPHALHYRFVTAFFTTG